MKSAITISRQMGSGGKEVAEIISQRLGWKLVDKNMLAGAAQKLGVDEVKIGNVFEHRPSLQDRMTMQQVFAKYLGVITQVIREFVDRGNVVVLGRGAHIILADDPRLFRVHLVADLDTRIERTAEQFKLRGKKGMEEARRMVVDSDYARSAYHNYVFEADWNDPLNYELVINTTTLTIDETANAIIAAFELLRG